MYRFDMHVVLVTGFLGVVVWEGVFRKGTEYLDSGNITGPFQSLSNAQW